MSWHKDINASPWISPEFDLTLDSQTVLHAIEQLTFAQMKREYNLNNILLNEKIHIPKSNSHSKIKFTFKNQIQIQMIFK